MFCMYCGKITPDDSTFCVNCGQSIKSNNNNSRSVYGVETLKCTSCGADLQPEQESISIICPYCGTKNIIIESNVVAVERIHSDITRDKMKIENENNVREEENLRQIKQVQAEQAVEDKDKEMFMNGIFSKIVYLFIICFMIFIPVSFVNGRLVSGILACIQTAIMIAVVLFGTGKIRKPFRSIHILLFIIGVSMSLL